MCFACISLCLLCPSVDVGKWARLKASRPGTKRTLRPNFLLSRLRRKGERYLTKRFNKVNLPEGRFQS